MSERLTICGFRRDISDFPTGCSWFRPEEVAVMSKADKAELMEGVKVVRIIGGDGSIQEGLDLAGSGYQGIIEVTKKGSANTLVKGLRRVGTYSEEVPEGIEVLLTALEGEHDLYLYQPPVMTWDEKQKILAYLAGSGPLSVVAEEWKEFFDRLPGMRKLVSRRVGDFYKLGGIGILASVAPLFSGQPGPEQLKFREDGKDYCLTGSFVAAEVIAVPALGPFLLNKEIVNQGQLCLLEMRDDSKSVLFSKSVLGLGIILIFPKTGLQRLINMKLINAHDVDQVQVVPSKRTGKNTSMSGELVEMTEPYNVTLLDSCFWVAIKRDE